MEAILDFSRPFNPELLDQIIDVFYNPMHPEQSNASKVLYDLKDNDHAWSVADSIVEKCHDPRSVFFGLILLEEMVKEKWTIIPNDQRESIKSFVLSKLSETMSNDNKKEDILHKWDIVMVEIFKKEWPRSWSSFVHDLVTSCTDSESRCRNSIFILKIVIEDVFQFSSTSLTSDRVITLQNALENDMIEIFNLCGQVIVNTQDVGLLLDTFDIIRLINKFLPDEYVFSYPLSEILLKFVELDAFRTSAMMCLHEILCHRNSMRYPGLVSQTLIVFLTFMKQYINVNIDLCEAYRSPGWTLSDFINELAQFLTSVALMHKKVLEADHHDLYLQMCTFILFLSSSPDHEVLKICMNFWKTWSMDIYEKFVKSKVAVGGPVIPRDPKKPAGDFTNLVQQVIILIIERMSRPEEIMVMENEDGEIVRVESKDTESIALYKTMRESLVLLSSVDYDITEVNFMNFLDIQMQKSSTDSFRNELQPLIWSIGSVSGVMNEADERRLLMATIMDLLRLVATKPTKDDKAVVASCLMYVIQQYPRFLKQHFKFLCTVINKNFEFMHETHPGVQDMACDTFLKLAKNCGQDLVISQTVDNVLRPPFINDIISKMLIYMELLNVQQREVFFEAVCSITKFERNRDRRMVLIDNILYAMNEEMTRIIRAGCADETVFHQTESLQNIRNIIRYNRVVCSVITIDYYKQVMIKYQDFVDLFILYSQAVISAVNQRGPNAIGYMQTRNQLLIKREIIRLMHTFVENYKQCDLGNGQVVDLAQFCNKFVPVLLNDFKNTPDCLKEPLILHFLACVIEKLKNSCKDMIGDILSSVYISSLQLITTNRMMYSDLCLAFYKLMENLSQFAFQFVFNFPDEEQKMLVDSIIWGYKDTERCIYESSLETMITIMSSVRCCEDQFRQRFYHSFLIYIIEHTLDVMTDQLHISVLPLISKLLQLLFSILLSQEVSTPLFSYYNNSYQNPIEAGKHLTQYICNKFPTCAPSIVNEYIIRVGNTFSKTENEFKIVNRDLLIRLKEDTNDSVDLYADEKERAKKQAEIDDLERRKTIPGLVAVNEMPTDFDLF